MFPAFATSLLHHFREIVAKHDLRTQDKIHQILKLLCHKLNVDVASIYGLEGLTSLNLLSIATAPTFQTRFPKLLFREGLWGHVVDEKKPVMFDDIRTHWKEISPTLLKGFLSVPLRRGDVMLGILTVQTRDIRQFQEEDVDLLLTLALIISEMMAADHSPQLGLKSFLSPTSFQGQTLASGMAIGYAFLHQDVLDTHHIIAQDITQELQLLFESLHHVHKDLRVLQRDMTNHSQEFMDIFNTYCVFAHDQGWLSQIQEIVEHGLTAEASVLQTIHRIRKRVMTSKDPFFREKLWDFEDLSRRLLRKLQNRPMTPVPHDQGIVVFADHLGPAELLDYQKFNLKGLVFQDDMALAHASIMARSLGIPVVGNVKSILSQVQWADLIILNADKGEIYLNPSNDKVRLAEKRIKKNHHLKYVKKIHQLPAITKDHHTIDLYLNGGSHYDLKHLTDVSVKGIGLYRTEIPFMMQKTFPNITYQERLYQDIYNETTKPVTFRTIDVGGDKVLPYQKHQREDNPALGWRAIRISLDRPAFLKEQLRALIRASQGRDLSIMFPMITHVQEFTRVKTIFNRELEREKNKGTQSPLSISLGAMVEVPSLVWSLDDLLKECDFISVGTNDLFQFFYAVDRSNSLVNDTYDVLSKPFLECLAYICQRCHYYQKPVSVCGEMASHPLEAMALLALGFTSLSVNSGCLLDIKTMIRALHLKHMQAFFHDIMIRSPFRIREALGAFAHDHAIPIKS